MAYYIKPNDLKYTDMAIWIDNNAYTEDCDQVKMFEYIYHIVKMLATKGCYFDSYTKYEDYSIFAATRIFMRYKNPKQFEVDDSGKPRMKKIVSVLNYAKGISYTTKVDFERTTYSNHPEEAKIEYSQSSLKDVLTSEVDELNVSNFQMYMHDIPSTINGFLTKLPYRKGTAEWANICMSCLLTLLSEITLSEKDHRKVTSCSNDDNGVVNKVYEKYRGNKVILYHLSDDMEDYIRVLVNEIRHIIFADLSQMLHSYVSSGSFAKASAPIEVLTENGNES